MSALDYLGRQIDVAAFQGFSADSSLLRQTLADAQHGGTIITGIFKLGQRFLLELLTERGSIPFDPARGCQFMTEARLGFIRNQMDLQNAFTRALVDVRRSLLLAELPTDPDDERFGGAEISQLTFAGGAAEISVLLASRDPQARIILPLPLAL